MWKDTQGRIVTYTMPNDSNTFLSFIYFITIVIHLLWNEKVKVTFIVWPKVGVTSGHIYYITWMNFNPSINK